jgi:beta-glucanase (GH16 family)
MKKIAIVFVFWYFIPVIPMVAQTWTLVWHDEFNGDVVNRQNWKFDTGGEGWGNSELEYYTSRPENASEYNGNLLIIARKENFYDNKYTSARMNTHGLERWTYGKIEARIKLPEQMGLWPAFWMLGDTIDDSGFPFCGEIDIMESINKDSTLYGTMHWASNNKLASYGGAFAVKDLNQFHIYSVEWDSLAIRWFVDGKQYWEGLIAENMNQTAAFHKPFFILLNLAVGGDWPGNPPPQTHFPDTMFVDYVRVYQMKQGSGR